MTIMMRNIMACVWVFLVFLPCEASAVSSAFKGTLYDPGILKPLDSQVKVTINDMAPDFTLKTISGRTVSLSGFRGISNVVLSFVPAAWTPVCSDQWPGYNLARPLFEKNDTILLGITVDNLPTLFAWTRLMGDLWFEVMSDFWPHGQVADVYGVLRGDGMAERALFVIDKQGRIRFIHVGNINVRPELGNLINVLESINKESK